MKKNKEINGRNIRDRHSQQNAHKSCCYKAVPWMRTLKSRISKNDFYAPYASHIIADSCKYRIVTGI